jgi:hypothetical protein
MPHVQLRGPCRPAVLAAALARLMETEPPEVRKILGGFLSLDGSRLILEALVVEAYLRQTFFLLLCEEPGGMIIRCHPVGAPQKTDGVKRLIASVARECLASEPDCSIGNTNLQGFL